MRYLDRQPQYGSLIPKGALPDYIPSGSVEMVLGGLLGYLIGNQRKQPAVGALLGVAVGTVIGQLKMPVTVPPVVVTPPSQGGGLAITTANVTDNTGRDWKIGIDAAGMVVSAIASIWKASK